MKNLAVLASALLLTAASPTPAWNEGQIQRLLAWSTVAQNEAIGNLAGYTAQLEQADRSGDRETIDRVATALAEKILTDYSQGCCNQGQRLHWHIANGLEAINPAQALRQALQADDLDALFRRFHPSHPYYLSLSKAYAREGDRDRKAALAINLDRWRWMPREPGPRYLLVNAANFEASLWQEGRIAGRWQVIVGKPRSPTPIFAARVTGVTINPWWDIPPDIARESIATLYAHNRVEANRRGYVRLGGRFRQSPGPNNALGRMKLVMPNPYHVYLHDTPAQALFAQETRAYSHGCVRVGRALDLAATLLGQPWDRATIDKLVEQRQTRTVDLRTPIPIFVTYFTAQPDDVGDVQYLPDIYRRDAGLRSPAPNDVCR